LRFKLNRRWVLIGTLNALIFAFLWLRVAAAASATIGTSVKKDENKKIRITANKLIAALDAGEIEFIGNVKATQASTVITSDRLKIFYKADATKSQTQIPQPETIEKIIAQGHVKIIHEDIIAETDMAEYDMQSEILVLTGERSNVTQGGHSISGTKFTLYRLAGKITIESNGKERVKAVFDASERDK